MTNEELQKAIKGAYLDGASNTIFCIIKMFEISNKTKSVLKAINNLNTFIEEEKATLK